MKFTTVLVALTAVVAASVSASPVVGSSESGLEVLGERSYERKARHVEVAARATESSEDLEARDWVSKSGKLTYYAGNQLNNPACGGPTPNDNSMVVAVKENGGYGSCGETVHIHYGGKMVSVKIVDYCASCEWGHFDGTKGVFKQLAPLSKGVLNGIHFKLFTNN